MKTLVLIREGNLSTLLLEDDVELEVKPNGTLVKDPRDPENPYIIGEAANPEEGIIFENIDAPEDWAPSKYCYTAEEGWTDNPYWEAIQKHRAEEAARVEEDLARRGVAS